MGHRLNKLFKFIWDYYFFVININANVSEVGFNRSFGVMVNYLYELKNIEKNHEDYINNKKVIISDKLKKFI